MAVRTTPFIAAGTWTVDPVHSNTSTLQRSSSSSSAAETDPLRAALRAWPERRSSAPARVELTRVALFPPEPVQAAARRLLTGLRLSEIDPVLTEAATIGKRFLRALDAIHLATAVRLGAELEIGP